MSEQTVDMLVCRIKRLEALVNDLREAFIEHNEDDDGYTCLACHASVDNPDIDFVHDTGCITERTV